MQQGRRTGIYYENAMKTENNLDEEISKDLMPEMALVLGLRSW